MHARSRGHENGGGALITREVFSLSYRLHSGDLGAHRESNDTKGPEEAVPAES